MRRADRTSDRTRERRPATQRICVQAGRRGYRGHGGPLRIAQTLLWIAFAAAIHYLVLFTPMMSGDRDPEEKEKQSSALAARKLIELVALARAEQDEKKAQPPEREEPQEEAVPPEKDEPQVEEPEPEPEQKREPEPEPAAEPDPVPEPEPDHSVRKEIEGSDPAPEEKPPEEAREEEPVQPPDPVVEEPVEPPPDQVSAAELRREEWRRIFEEPEKADGHFYAAMLRWQEQARRKADERSRRSEGEEDGLPQLDRDETMNDKEFFSALDLFGGEVFVRIGSSDWWHLARDGHDFTPLPTTERGIKRVARQKGLNLGFMIALDRYLDRLPQQLLAARAGAIEKAGREGGTGVELPAQTYFVGTTREQSAVADAAQVYLRRNREQFPDIKIWSSAKYIYYHYLLDEHRTVYGVEIKNIE